MSKPFEQELRYVVFKEKDLKKYIDQDDWDALQRIEKKIYHGRNRENREQLLCVIVEHDWPMYEDTWKQIKDYYEENHGSGTGSKSKEKTP